MVCLYYCHFMVSILAKWYCKGTREYRLTKLKKGMFAEIDKPGGYNSKLEGETKDDY